jgi:hypothetical protein
LLAREIARFAGERRFRHHYQSSSRISENRQPDVARVIKVHIQRPNLLDGPIAAVAQPAGWAIHAPYDGRKHRGVAVPYRQWTKYTLSSHTRSAPAAGNFKVLCGAIPSEIARP